MTQSAKITDLHTAVGKDVTITRIHKSSGDHNYRVVGQLVGLDVGRGVVTVALATTQANRPERLREVELDLIIELRVHASKPGTNDGWSVDQYTWRDRDERVRNGLAADLSDVKVVEVRSYGNAPADIELDRERAAEARHGGYIYRVNGLPPKVPARFDGVFDANVRELAKLYAAEGGYGYAPRYLTVAVDGETMMSWPIYRAAMAPAERFDPSVDAEALYAGGYDGNE
jgi:hypothetical protein